MHRCNALLTSLIFPLIRVASYRRDNVRDAQEAGYGDQRSVINGNAEI